MRKNWSSAGIHETLTSSVALRAAALLGTALIFVGAFVSTIWGAENLDLARDSTGRAYATAWIGLILLVIVVGIALRTSESARRGSLEDAPWLAAAGVVATMTSIFLFGGAIGATGGMVMALGGIAGALARHPVVSAESLK